MSNQNFPYLNTIIGDDELLFRRVSYRELKRINIKSDIDILNDKTLNFQISTYKEGVIISCHNVPIPNDNLKKNGVVQTTKREVEAIRGKYYYVKCSLFPVKDINNVSIWDYSHVSIQLITDIQLGQVSAIDLEIDARDVFERLARTFRLTAKMPTK